MEPGLEKRRPRRVNLTAIKLIKVKLPFYQLMLNACPYRAGSRMNNIEVIVQPAYSTSVLLSADVQAAILSKITPKKNLIRTIKSDLLKY